MTHKRPGHRAISQRQERAQDRLRASQGVPEAPEPEPEVTPRPESKLARVKIDLNVRTRGGTYAGFEDLNRPVYPGEEVEVFESESGPTGAGKVIRIDPIRKIVVLSVDWKTLKLS